MYVCIYCFAMLSKLQIMYHRDALSSQCTTHPAYIAAKLAITHSGELRPIIATPENLFNPN